MIDNHLDKKLLDLNQRYQKIIKSQSYVGNVNRKRYIDNLMHLRIRSLIEDIKYRSYGKHNFSTKGNALRCIEEEQNIKK